MSAARPLRRDPVAITLVLVNLGLAGFLIRRHFSPPPHAGLPVGHPDVSVPGELIPPTFAVSGVVELSPALKDPWPAGAHVFVIARPETGGPPYAVRRYDGLKPPFAFTLGPDNEMLKGGPAPRRLVISVRVDQDGDAMTRQLGDLESAPSAAVATGAAVPLVIDRPAILVP